MHHEGNEDLQAALMKSTTETAQRAAANASRAHEIKTLPYKSTHARLSDIKRAVRAVIKERRATQAGR
jgi:hypothetical protein